MRPIPPPHPAPPPPPLSPPPLSPHMAIGPSCCLAEYAAMAKMTHMLSSSFTPPPPFPLSWIRELHFRFLRSPAEVVAGPDGAAGSLRLEKNSLSGATKQSIRARQPRQSTRHLFA